MSKSLVTMSRKQLSEALSSAASYPHENVHKGVGYISDEAFMARDRETNMYISPEAMIDLTGSIFFGPWCMIGARSRVYTHDHIHLGKRPLLQVQEELGIMWQDKYIGADVWVHDSAIVLYQVTKIPNGVVVGAGSVLTKNPGAYEIWAGSPARRVGVREEVEREAIDDMLNANRYSLEGLQT